MKSTNARKNFIKGLFIPLLSFLVLFSFAMGVMADNDIKVYLNTSRVAFDTQPIMMNSRVLVPIRAIFEKFGGVVNYNSSNSSANCSSNGVNIYLQAGNRYASIGGKTVELDVPAMIINNRMYAPLRFVSEALGASVYWNGNTQSVFIYVDSLDVV